MDVCGLAGCDRLFTLTGVDPLSDVLQVLRLSGAILFRARLSAPWCFSIPQASEMSAVLLRGAGRLVRFHIMVEGECLVLGSHEAVRLGPRDVIVLPRGDAHVMCSAEGVAPVPVMSVLPELRSDALPTLECPGRGPTATLLCGFLGCDEPIFDPLLGSLPAVIVDRRDRGPSGSWLDAMLEYTMRQNDSDQAAGGRYMQTRLVELMFLDVLRRHMTSAPPDQLGWLSALRDPQVGRAMAELHADPARAWTVSTLAKRVGVSRSTLAARFRDATGVSPMHYLTGWRLQLAVSLLKQGELSIAEAAARVGYQSEAAFNRAFKRRVGEPPATWRLRQSRLVAARV